MMPSLNIETWRINRGLSYEDVVNPEYFKKQKPRIVHKIVHTPPDVKIVRKIVYMPPDVKLLKKILEAKNYPAAANGEPGKLKTLAEELGISLYLAKRYRDMINLVIFNYMGRPGE